MNNIKWLLFPVIIITAITSCTHRNELFTPLSSSRTNIRFENTLTPRKAFGIMYYLYYYNGGGVATGDINNDGLPDVYFTANSRGNNKLYLNKGDFKFEDITQNAGVAGNSDWCSGVTMADVNGDGFLDIYVSAVANHHGLEGRNELFLNNRNGTFTESAAVYGLDFSGFTSQTAFFDYDNDGDLDCFMLNQSIRPNENANDTSSRRKFDRYAGDRLYRNDMNTAEKKFTDVSAAAGIYQSSLGYGLGLSVADFNNDGWLDIYAGNDFQENDYYYLNNGKGGFTESGAQHFGHYSRFSMGNDAADFNNDGQLDLVTVDMLPADEKTLKTYGSDENPDIYKFKLTDKGFQYQYSRNCLQRNNGDGTSFSDVALLGGVSATDWSWSPLFADFDNDGSKDLFVSSGIVKRPVDLDYVRFMSDPASHRAINTGKYDDQAVSKMPDGSSHPFLFKGDGQTTFKDVSNDWGTGNMKGYFTGASYADLDNDGRLDLVINAVNGPAVILKNNTPSKNYLSISFRGDGLNTTGIGCKAWLFGDGKIQYQQLMLTRGFQSSSDTRLHFGLDSLASIDSVLIVWPGQRFQVIRNVTANKPLVVQQKNASGVFDQQTFFKQPRSFFTRLDDIEVNWQHREDPFFDNNVQYLIPHAESTRGPKIAVGDVDGDGLDDFYACGAIGQAGTLMIQKTDGSFHERDTAVFAADAAAEDVDAVFFDANDDGAPDLYVVSGGNEYDTGSPQLYDRLYLNNGRGHFVKSSGSLPAELKNKSCVAVADIDHDGDTDIFVGTLANAKAYGIPQTSHLFLNDGKANYSVAGESTMALSEIGMVTAARFTDINNDGWADLILAGEFMPLTIFINKKGKFEKSIIPNSSGWWQTLYTDDVNGDGHMDILAGNWGWNNKFRSGKDGPVRMYVSDFDKNGQIDQLLSYTLKGQEFPFLAKDEVERSLPQLKKRYLSYADFAGLPMKDVFYGWIDTIKPLEATRLGSVVCYGDGRGNFSIEDLPADLQLAPVFSFQKIGAGLAGKNLFIAGGNFFDVIPYEGRYDAQALALFSVDKQNRVNVISQSNLLQLKEQVRDLKWLRSARHGDLLVVAVNNNCLSFYGYEK